ncbi:MAG: hypothetical protein JSW23_12035 [Planctomycetota bacterium]|nr:MAG: hypothetical protein JSW23_12035 [Planctomycetota bacterium]
MELKLDVKTLIIGIALGVIVTATLGQVSGSADKADFGIAVQTRGFALVRAVDGLLYSIDMEKSKAELIENTDNRNRPLNLNTALAPERYSPR